MPYRRGRRRRGQRRRRWGNVLSVSANPPPVGWKRVVRHRYNDQGVIQLVNGALPNAYTTWSFKVNDLYDPDATVGGHQPFGRDQMAALFGRYCVIGGRLGATGHITNGDGSQWPVYVGIAVSESPTLSGVTLAQLVEGGRANIKLTNSANISGYQNLKYVNLWRSFNIKRELADGQVMDDDSLQAITADGSPTRVLYMHLLLGNGAVNAVTATTIYFHCHLLLEQIVVYYDPLRFGTGS